MSTNTSWEEAYDEVSGRAYYFNRLTGDTSWTLPGESTAEGSANGSGMDNAWQQSFDEASQTTYYYNIYTGETSWTLPEVSEEQDEDLSYLTFAVVRLQAMFHGRKDRKRVRGLVRAQYQCTFDPTTGNTLYTNLQSNTSSWTKPALFGPLGIPDDGGVDEGDEDGDDDDDDDFEGFQQDAERDADEEETAATLAANEDNEDEDDEESTKKKQRKFPRSKAQQIVDAAEDSTEPVHLLDMSGLGAWKLTSRLWNLQYLKTLVLSHNHLERIPSGIQDLIHLEEIDVSHNQLTRLPSCLQTTKTLSTIRASHNLIQAFSPKLWKLREIRHLDLSHNRLKELPYVEGDLKLLRETREWQIGVGLLVALEVLLLNDNQLTQVPKSIEKCASLKLLDLSNNQLTILSDEIAALTSLERLAVHHNAVRVLPESIGNLFGLQELDLAHNRLVTLPESIGDLQSLETLQLFHNDLKKLPLEFGALTQLRYLDLDNNDKLINLDTCFRQLQSVCTFSASSCGIMMFESLDFLKDSPVQILRLQQNALAEFPLLIGHAAMQDTLQELVLAGNFLTQVPLAVLLYCSHLQHLDVSSNLLRVLPTEIAHLRRLQVLILSNNSLQELPDGLAQLTRLKDLKCDHNLLERLPLRIGKLTQLAKLNVSFNRLGSLPTSLADLAQLKTLQANDNLVLAAPPSIYHLRCFCDFSNNPFAAEQHTIQQNRRGRTALTMKLIDAGHFDRAEKLISDLLVDVKMFPYAEQQLQTPLLHFKRGLCRYMLVKRARQVIDDTSSVISSSEQEMHGSELVSARHLRVLSKQKRALENQPETPSDEGVQPEDEQDENAVLPQDTVKTAYVEAVSKRSQAREQHQTFANGALQDLEIAIQFGNVELTTAYHLKGLAHMALHQYGEAIDTFTRALECIHAPLPDTEPTDNQQEDSNTEVDLAPTIPESSIRLFLRRAEAYRGLGQLPSAIMDLRHVISRYPIQLDSADIVALEAEYTNAWEDQQAACALDDAALLRAFNVKASSGLARRPEVHDAHAEALAAAIAKKKSAKKQVKTKRLPPDVRFRLECATKIEALESEKQQRRAPFEAISVRSRVFLTRARDFKREIRATLEMEIEENRQRQLEQEIAREAERKRLELQREFDERMVMKYEDEWMHWFVSEEIRLEEERRRRVEEAQRRADAKAAYATRLSKRGGKRQAAAQRGKGNSRNR